ncbi:hypothetical protein K1719_010392 [Acacia pycnantha]|nr:hypothetical protein K1719_010392 [Acacia pycnantha]
MANYRDAPSLSLSTAHRSSFGRYPLIRGKGPYFICFVRLSLLSLCVSKPEILTGSLSVDSDRPRRVPLAQQSLVFLHSCFLSNALLWPVLNFEMLYFEEFLDFGYV